MDTFEDDKASGAVIVAETERLVQQIQREAHKPKRVAAPEPALQSVIKRMTDAALPSLRASAKELQRVKAENEQYRRAQEREWSRQALETMAAEEF